MSFSSKVRFHNRVLEGFVILGIIWLFFAKPLSQSVPTIDESRLRQLECMDALLTMSTLVDSVVSVDNKRIDSNTAVGVAYPAIIELCRR